MSLSLKTCHSMPIRWLHSDAAAISKPLKVVSPGHRTTECRMRLSTWFVLWWNWNHRQGSASTIGLKSNPIHSSMACVGRALLIRLCRVLWSDWWTDNPRSYLIISTRLIQKLEQIRVHIGKLKNSHINLTDTACTEYLKYCSSWSYLNPHTFT